MPDLSTTEVEILTALDGRGGYLTRDIAKHVTYCSDHSRARSGAVRAYLNTMAAKGWVTQIFADKPACWRLTAVGSEILREHQRVKEGYEAIHREALAKHARR